MKEAGRGLQNQADELSVLHQSQRKHRFLDKTRSPDDMLPSDEGDEKNAAEGEGRYNCRAVPWITGASFFEPEH